MQAAAVPPNLRDSPLFILNVDEKYPFVVSDLIDELKNLHAGTTVVQSVSDLRQSLRDRINLIIIGHGLNDESDIITNGFGVQKIALDAIVNYCSKKKFQVGIFLCVCYGSQGVAFRNTSYVSIQSRTFGLEFADEFLNWFRDLHG